MRVLGMISGTSHDGIDVAVCDFARDGDELRGTIEHVGCTPYADELRAALVAALPPAPTTLEEVTRLDALIGTAFAHAARQALDEHRRRGYAAVDLVCSHGQTAYHWVEGGTARGTLQLGHPSWIGEATGLPVVSDLRMADVAVGGQGAPLVPLLDQLVLEPLVARGRTVAALNLGGIANLTVCAPGRDPVAWDTGPANALVDAVVAADASTADAFDRDGDLARRGSVVDELLDAFLAEPYYALPPPKSTGKELLHSGYVDEVVARWAGRVELPDLVATLTALTGRTVGRALRGAGVEAVYASGGGTHNPVLMAAVAASASDVEVDTTRPLGLDPDAKEAVAFALLGWCTAHGVPGNVPSCTGASQPRVLGRVTPAPDGTIPLPGRGVAAPRRLVLEDVTR